MGTLQKAGEDRGRTDWSVETRSRQEEAEGSKEKHEKGRVEASWLQGFAVQEGEGEEEEGGKGRMTHWGRSKWKEGGKRRHESRGENWDAGKMVSVNYFRYEECLTDMRGCRCPGTLRTSYVVTNSSQIAKERVETHVLNQALVARSKIRY